jgi:hypothetical protein
MQNQWEIEAFRFFVLGLNSKEIGKLLDKSYRTIQGVMSRNNWKEKRKEIKAKEEKRIIRKYLKAQKNESRSI